MEYSRSIENLLNFSMPTLTPQARESLIRAAFEAKENSYSPHSNFPVGASLMTKDGSIVKGASIDCASYGATICAERTALVKAISDGMRSFVALAIVSNVASPIFPCGICRQFISEFCYSDMPILLVPGDYLESATIGDSEKTPVRNTTLGELLPDALRPKYPGLSRK